MSTQTQSISLFQKISSEDFSVILDLILSYRLNKRTLKKICQNGCKIVLLAFLMIMSYLQAAVAYCTYTHRNCVMGMMQRNFGVLKQSIWFPHWDTGTLFHPA